MPVTLRSRFTPLTYDEIARPLIEQTAAQEAMENAYSETQDQASQLMAQANEQTDPIAHARLKNYAAALQQQADNLMRNGLNRNSRAALLNTRKRYNQDVVPVQQAVTRRNELMEELRKLRIQNPDMLVERDVIGIDDLLRNPQLDYGSTYNGAMITKRVADAAKAVGDSMVSMETAGHLTPYQIKVLEKHGFTADEIAAAVAGGQDAKSQMLAGIRDRVLGSIDVYNKGNDATKARALSYANEGLYAGIGSSRYSTVADERAKAELGWEFDKRRMDYQHQIHMQEQAAAQQAAQEAALQAQLSAIVPSNIYSQEEIDDMNLAGEKWSKYFDVSPDGTYTLNEEGRKEYNRILKKQEYPYSRHPGPTYEDNTDFRKFMNSLIPDKVDAVTYAGGETPSRDLNLTNEQIGKAFGDYITAPKKYDATKLTEYNYNIAGGDRDEWTNIIANAANNTLYQANWDKKEKVFTRGNGESIEDALSDGGKVSAIQYSPYGLTLKVTKSNGHSQRYILPSGINAPMEDNLKITMSALQKVQNLYKQAGNGYVPMPTEIKTVLKQMGYTDVDIPQAVTKEELAMVATMLQANGQFYVSQLMNTNQTTPQKWNLIAQ